MKGTVTVLISVPSTEAEFWFMMTTLMFINLQLSEMQKSLKQTEV